MKLRTKIIAVVSALALSLVGWAIPATAADYSGLRVLQSLYKEVEPEASPSASEESSDPPPPEGGEESAADEESAPEPEPAAEEETEAPEPAVKESPKSSEKTEKNTEAPAPEAKESPKSSEKTEKNTEAPASEADESSETDQPESKATESAPSTQRHSGSEPKVCPDDEWYGGKWYGDKVDTRGDPSSVEVTAPSGKLIAGYCVKAGNDLDFVTVDPPQKTVEITDEDDDKDVSHYSLVLVNDSKVYYCAPKSEGSERWKVHTFYTSDEIPAWVTEAGYVVKERDSHCEPPVEVCENLLSDGNTLEDIEATLPAGVEIREKDNGDCYYYVYVCWQITNGTDDITAGEKAAVNGSHFPQTWAGEAASKDAVLSLEGCAPTPVCTDSTWWQVDKYKIENASDHDVLEGLRASGTLEWLGYTATDHDIWTPLEQHWIIEKEGDYTDCTNTGTVPVCVPDDNSPSGYSQGVLTWTYTKDADGEGYTTDMDVPHPAYTVLNHLAETYATVDAHDDWNQEFYDKGCANMTEVCVPVGESNGVANAAFTTDTPAGPQNPWTIMEVTEDQADTKYADNPRPNKDGYCEFRVFVCWEIVSGDNDPVQLNPQGHPQAGLPKTNAANFTPAQAFVQWAWSFEELDKCWEPEELCGPGTWYQLDRYLIENEDELAHLITLMANGLGWTGQPADHNIYNGQHYFFFTGSGEDCTNTGTVPVCVPDDNAASGYVQGLLTWTYTKDADGEGYTTDMDVPHPAYTVLNHLAETYATVDAHDDWNQEFYDNGCQGDVDICVPAGEQQLELASVNGPSVPSNPWMIITVSEQEYLDDYPNAFEPNKKGFCGFEVFVCWEINGGVELLATTGPDGYKSGVTPANFDPPQTYIGYGDSFDALKALENCAPTPVCGDMNAFQLDKYEILSDSDYATLMHIIANGLGMDGSKYADHALYVDHLIIKQVAEDCTNTGTVPVCVPDDNAASGYVQGLLTWTYTKDENGEGYTTDIDVPHPAYTVLNHLTEVYANVDAHDGWNQEFYDNGCQGDVDICVPAGDGNDDLARGPATADRGYVVKTVTEQEFKDYYSDYPLPVEGECPESKGKVTICHNNNGAKDYSVNTVSWHAIGNKITGFNDGQFLGNGHGSDNGTHGEDIIPPFVVQYTNGDVYLDYPGKNWEGWSDQEWSDFTRNGCQPLTEICPVDLEGDASEWEPTSLFHWEYKFWKHTKWTGDPEDCFDPTGFTSVCYPDPKADDGWSKAYGKWWANWTSDDEWSFRGFWLIGTAPFDADDENFPGWSLESFGVIVPPIDSEHYGVDVDHPGVNWTPLNEAIYGSGCDPVDEIVNVDLVHVTCENPEGGAIDAAYQVATGNGNVQIRLYRLVEGEKVYLNPDGTPAAEGEMPLLHEVIEGAGQHDFGVTGLAHGTYGFETVNAANQETYGGEFTIERPEEECATLNPDILSGICVDGIPYMDFTIQVQDKFGEVDLSQGAVFTLTDDEGEGAPFSHQLPAIPLALATQDGITYSYDEDTMTHTWTGQVLWPGASVDPQGWPGWAFNEATGTYENVGTDNFGWTRDGMTVTVKVNPEAEFEADVYPSEEPDCPNPPSYDICEWDGTENMPVQTTLYGTAPEDAVLWIDGSECTPVVICELLSGEPETGEYGETTIMKSEYDPEVHQMWNPDAEVQGGCREAQEPTLAGSLLSSVCVADSPWLAYNVDLTDPDSQSTDNGIATITFVHPTDESQNVVMEVPVGAGYVMWPGASVAPAEGYTEADIDPTNPATFVPTGWPGWAQDASGEWVSIGLDNFGWTRYGIEVRLDVNPSTSLTVNYPPPTPTCVSSPPAQAVSTEAPAATPVAARVITYTG